MPVLGRRPFFRWRSQHPKEMYFLAFTEMCQRFSFWGTAFLLVLYLVQYQKMADASADLIYGVFTGVAFALPIIGGWIADRTDYRKCIIAGCILGALGCFMLATRSIHVLYPALACITLGGGMFTPSIYAMLGKVYHVRHPLRDAGFSIYYATVNIGVFIALLILGSLAQLQDWVGAFVVAGLVQLLALVPFFRVSNSNVIGATTTRREYTKGRSKQSWLFKKPERDRIIVIAVLALFSIIFWMAYNQGGSSMTLFALRFTDRNFSGHQIPTPWLLSSETLFLIILALPLAYLYSVLAAAKKEPSPISKVVLGLCAIGICFAIMAFGSLDIPTHAQGGSVSPWVLIFAFFFMALGELLIMPIGLSLVTHIAPRRFTALLVGVWYLCLGIAFYLGGVIASYMSSIHNLTGFFSIFVAIALATAVILQFVAKKLNAMRHMDAL